VPSVPAIPALPLKTYDVCFYVNGRPLLRMLDHGIGLGHDSITWTTRDSQTTEMAFGNIVAINLKSTGSRVIVEQCAITFADNSVLTVVNSGPGGYSDRQRALAYRDVVRDLHARLAAGAFTAIRFTAGVPRGRYLAMLAFAAAMALVCGIIGLMEFLTIHDWRGPILILVGGYSSWRLGRKALANAPRDYTPDRPPENLLT
jgi:hypothetical protein